MRRALMVLAMTVALVAPAFATSDRARGAEAPTPAKAAEGKETAFASLSEIAGVTLSCTDFRGQSVKTVQMANLGDVGRAWLISRVPLIALDPTIMRTLPSKLQLFFFGHECAHHVLAHSYVLSTTMESDADCWSIKNGRDRGLFSRDDVVNFAPWLMKSTGSPWGHLPGPERSRHLLKCFDEP